MQPQAPATEAIAGRHGCCAAGPGLAGISATELDVMQAAAARFLEHHGTGMPGAAAVTGGMRTLREPAAPQAAGAVSARRDIYSRHQGTHFMAMPYYAD